MAPYPRYRDDFLYGMPLYHVNNIKPSVPLAFIVAKVIYFSHREAFPIDVPPHLPQA